ncbi:MAG TPA: GNAT family protein [Candidatus Dormibacteraeota bacterium]
MAEIDDPAIVRDRVRLRRVTTDDTEVLERWQSTKYVGEFNDFGIQAGSVAERIQKTGLVSAQSGTLIVELEANRLPIGTVGWREVRYGPNPESAAWQIGINLIPEARGKGYGSEAQRLLAAHLLATSRVNRIEAMTDIDNLAEQRALEKAGFVREGVLRGAQFRSAGWHDMVVYSRVRATP